jgi:hypothetical protein
MNTDARSLGTPQLKTRSPAHIVQRSSEFIRVHLWLHPVSKTVEPGSPEIQRPNTVG